MPGLWYQVQLPPLFRFKSLAFQQLQNAFARHHGCLRRSHRVGRLDGRVESLIQRSAMFCTPSNGSWKKKYRTLTSVEKDHVYLKTKAPVWRRLYIASAQRSQFDQAVDFLDAFETITYVPDLNAVIFLGSRLSPRFRENTN